MLELNPLKDKSPLKLDEPKEALFQTYKIEIDLLVQHGIINQDVANLSLYLIRKRLGLPCFCIGSISKQLDNITL